MLLFLHPIAPSLLCIVFHDGKIVHEESHMIRGREFEEFPELLHRIMKSFPITKIALVNGPGPFTSLRIITLVLNTLALVRKIPLIPVHFFELGTIMEKSLPYCLKANRGEYLIRSTDGEDSLRDISSLSGKYWGLGDEADFPDKNVTIDMSIDFSHILAELERRDGVEMIAPRYIKDPKITPPKGRSPEV